MSNAAQDLRRLDEALAVFEDRASEHPPGVLLMRESLARRREAILAVLAMEQELMVDLVRPSRRGSGAELKLVAGVLASLQDGLSSIAQTLSGRPTARGLIPGAVVESVELRIATASPGSLHLQLTPAFPETQTPLFEDGEESTLDLSVGRLLSVIRSANAQPAEVLSQVAELGPRATVHLLALAKVLSDGEADLEMNWRSPRASGRAGIDAATAGRLRAVIESVHESHREAVYTGRIVGGSLVRATFELELEDGSVLRGAADPGVLPTFEELFGQACAANIATRVLRLQSGEVKETHRLVHLEP